MVPRLLTLLCLKSAMRASGMALVAAGGSEAIPASLPAVVAFPAACWGPETPGDSGLIATAEPSSTLTMAFSGLGSMMSSSVTAMPAQGDSHQAILNSIFAMVQREGRAGGEGTEAREVPRGKEEEQRRAQRERET